MNDRLQCGIAPAFLFFRTFGAMTAVQSVIYFRSFVKCLLAPESEFNGAHDKTCRRFIDENDKKARDIV